MESAWKWKGNKKEAEEWKKEERRKYKIFEKVGEKERNN